MEKSKLIKILSLIFGATALAFFLTTFILISLTSSKLNDTQLSLIFFAVIISRI